MDPPPPPPPPPAPVTREELHGSWSAAEADGRTAHFTMAVAADGTVSIRNPSDSTSCWSAGNGTVDLAAGELTVAAAGPDCVRHATGTVRRDTLRRVVDVEYVYESPTLLLTWAVQGGHWPAWRKPLGPWSIG